MLNKKDQLLGLVCSVLLLFSCTEKLEPGKEAEKNRKEIIDAAPISFEYKIKEPREDTPSQLKAFLGQWVGRWKNIFASQLVITEINSTNVTFIYSWESIPQRNIEGGEMRDTMELDSHGRISFQKDSAVVTFAVDTLLNKIIGVKIEGDIVSNIVMEKVR